MKKQFFIQFKVALVCFTLGTFYSGCTTDPGPPTLWDITFSKSVSHQSTKSVKLVLKNGEVWARESLGFIGIGFLPIIPYTYGPYPAASFNYGDQRIFSYVFHDELERLKLFRSITDLKSAPPSDIEIHLFFKKTSYEPLYHDYILDVEMNIIGRVHPFRKQYHILSSEGDSFWKKTNTSASEGKAKAGAKLLDQLIVDLHSWVAADQKVTLKE